MRVVTENKPSSSQIDDIGGSVLNLQGEKLITGQNRKLKVLLADDSKVTRTVFSHILEKNGHQVVTANDGSEAVARFQQESFDAILMDVQMPLMNGLNATRMIRAKELTTGAHIPILALTASDTKNDLEKCLQTGMDGYIHKNVTAAELLETLASYVNKVSGGENPEPKSFAARVGDLSAELTPDNDVVQPEDNERCMKTLCRYLHEALEYRNEALMEKYSLSLKRLASQAKSSKVADETFRVQLAFRRGDFDKAALHLAALESILSEVAVGKGFKFDM
jgi:CheY-like chemotaxis protein